MSRIFIADEREFSDPDPTLPVNDVQQMLADFLPELHNAEVIEEPQGTDILIQFVKKVGTKGWSPGSSY